MHRFLVGVADVSMGVKFLSGPIYFIYQPPPLSLILLFLWLNVHYFFALNLESTIFCLLGLGKSLDDDFDDGE